MRKKSVSTGQQLHRPLTDHLRENMIRTQLVQYNGDSYHRHKCGYAHSPYKGANTHQFHAITYTTRWQIASRSLGLHFSRDESRN